MQLWLIPLFPFAGFLVNGFFGRRMSKLAVSLVACGSVLLSFLWVLKTISAVGYMAHEGGYYRFFAYFNLFMFFMLILVLGANFLLLFVGWEGVGLCSYLLIGFYFLEKFATDAGNKAFIVNLI